MTVTDADIDSETNAHPEAIRGVFFYKEMISVTAEQLIEWFRRALEDKYGYIFGQSGTMWTQSDQNLKVNYMIRNYGPDWKKSADAKKDNYYKSALLGSKWIGHNVADCSGMFVGAYRKYGLSIAHGSTSIYKNYCDQKGRLTESLKKTLVPGAAVFTGDTENDHPHVGLYVGNGKVIEAQGVDAGVCVSNLSANKWKWYGLLKAVTYGEKGEETVPSITYPTIKKGSKGEYVTKAQTILHNLGYDLGSYGIDGDFGKATEAAVKEFQGDHKLTKDGVIGPMTWEELMKADGQIRPEPEPLFNVEILGLTQAQVDELKKKYPNVNIIAG